MSLPSLALLIVATGALREVLPPWTKVVAAPGEPQELVEEGGKVLVAVFTGDEVHPVQRRRLGLANPTVELAVQVLCPPRVEAVVELQGRPVAANLETHGAGAFAVFMSVHRAIERGLGAPDPGSWGELWQDFVVGLNDDLERRPFLAQSKATVAIPACDFSLPCELIPSPPLGGELPEVWGKLLTKMRADPAVSGLADYVEAEIRGNPLEPWRAELALAGLSRWEGEALGYGTLAGTGATPAATRLTIGTPRGDLVVEGADDE